MWKTKVFLATLLQEKHNSETVVIEFLFPFLYFIVHWELTLIYHMIVNRFNWFYYVQKLLSSITHCKAAITSKDDMQENNQLSFLRTPRFLFFFSLNSLQTQRMLRYVKNQCNSLFMWTLYLVVEKSNSRKILAAKDSLHNSTVLSSLVNHHILNQMQLWT